MAMSDRMRERQRGAFAVEFSIIGIIMFALLFFSVDVAIKLGMKGRLDRLSYSAVNLIKEQTSLAEDYSFSATNVFKIIRNSLYRTTAQGAFDENNLTVLVEILSTEISGNALSTTQTSSLSGNSSSPLGTGSGTPLKNYVDSLATSVVTETDDSGNTQDIILTLAPYLGDGNYADVYQVSVCYKTENWYGEFIDSINNSGGSSFEWVCSNSIAFSR